MDIAETTKRRDLASRPVPVLARLPRPVYARAEQMQRKAATVAHAHDWVQFSYASRGVLQVQTHQGLFIAPPQWAILIPPHCDPTVNLYDRYAVCADDMVEAFWPVTARGRLG